MHPRNLTEDELIRELENSGDPLQQRAAELLNGELSELTILREENRGLKETILDLEDELECGT